MLAESFDRAHEGAEDLSATGKNAPVNDGL
jgi:hypothetical protein